MPCSISLWRGIFGDRQVAPNNHQVKNYKKNSGTLIALHTQSASAACKGSGSSTNRTEQLITSTNNSWKQLIYVQYYVLQFYGQHLEQHTQRQLQHCYISILHYTTCTLLFGGWRALTTRAPLFIYKTKNCANEKKRSENFVVL